MSYPQKAELKTLLQATGASDDLCEKIATDFGGSKIACDHRVPQRQVFKVGNSLKSDPDQVAKCADVLCSYGDQAHCKTK